MNWRDGLPTTIRCQTGSWMRAHSAISRRRSSGWQQLSGRSQRPSLSLGARVTRRPRSARSAPGQPGELNPFPGGSPWETQEEQPAIGIREFTQGLTAIATGAHDARALNARQGHDASKTRAQQPNRR
jgi:hypothetical protein